MLLSSREIISARDFGLALVGPFKPSGRWSSGLKVTPPILTLRPLQFYISPTYMKHILWYTEKKSS